MPAAAPLLASSWFLPAVTAATAIGSGAMQYQGQKKAQEATERAAERESQDRARIAAEAEQNQVAQNSAMQAQQQEARKAFSQRLTNRSEVLRQELARQNLLGTPAGSGRQAELEAEGVRSADRLSADLAGQGEQARQRALYSLPGLSERGTRVQQELGASDPFTKTAGEASQSMMNWFGRTQQGGGLTGYTLSSPRTTPGITPTAPAPLPARTGAYRSIFDQPSPVLTTTSPTIRTFR